MRNLSRGIDIFMPHELNKVKWSIYFHFFVFRFCFKTFLLNLLKSFVLKKRNSVRYTPNFGKFLRCLEGPLSHLL